jgi:GNAT superfamily N-acetyltransferase
VTAIPASYTIARATPDDTDALPAIERRAAERFAGWNVPRAIMQEATSLAALQAAQAAGLLWVALDRNGDPVGFACVASSRDRVHLEELDVLPEHGRRGVGTALVREIVQWAAASGHRELTLTTFRDVPWNGPFYEMLGFEIVDPRDLDAELSRRLETEAARGLEPARRVAMRLRLTGRVPENREQKDER